MQVILVIGKDQDQDFKFVILVIGKVDMINQICQMLSFCWKLVSAYFAEKNY